MVTMTYLINQRKQFSIEVHTNRCRSEQSTEHDTKFSTVTLTMLMYLNRKVLSLINL